MKFHLALAVLAAAFSTTPLAQPASGGADAATKKAASDKSAEKEPAYRAGDCRKDMANAREAQQAGHITEKEYAEQKKMAQTKMNRDTGREAGGGNAAAPCQ